MAYLRSSISCPPDAQITHQTYDPAGRANQSRDPRLFNLLDSTPDAPANLVTVFTLSGTALLTDSTDAGWNLSLVAEARQPLESWDNKLNHTRTNHDPRLRPVEVFEQTECEPEKRRECFSYGDAKNAFAIGNQCGQLIRHDDTAGTECFPQFSLAATPLEQARYFLNDFDASVNWPVELADRDLLLEDNVAVTLIDYNAVGEVRSQTDAQGNTQFWSHTVAGQLRAVQLTLADRSTMTLASAFDYDVFGHVERQTVGNGVTTTAMYCSLTGRLKRLTAKRKDQSTMQDLSYCYDPVGNVLDIKDAAQPIRYFRNQRVEARNTYEYDSLYRLIRATGRQAVNGVIGPQLPEFQSPADPDQLENYTLTFNYLAGGNLDERVLTAGSRSQTLRMGTAKYSNRSLPQKANGELPTDSEIAHGFDAKGNLKVLQPGQPLGWNGRNQLCRIDQVTREDGPCDTEVYIYDGSGQRRRKIRSTYTGPLKRLNEVRYLPGLEIRKCLGQTLHVVAVDAGYCSVQVLIWEQRAPSGAPQNQPHYSLNDHLGSSTLVLDENADLISQEWFYCYGATACWAGRDNPLASYKTRRYSGKERDATGLYYYGFRYYAPWLQRWINPDPAGTVDGLNLYAFVGNNPAGRIDTDGRMWGTADLEEFSIEFARLQSVHSPFKEAVAEGVEETARDEGSQVLAQGLGQFPEQEQKQVYRVLNNALRFLQTAETMIEQYPAESSSVLRDFFGKGYKQQTSHVLRTIKQTRELMSQYTYSSWGAGKFAKLSLALGRAAEANIQTGSIILFEQALNRSDNRLAWTLIHEFSHFGGVDEASSVGPETDDLWYLPPAEDGMSRREFSAEFVRHGSSLPGLNQTRAAFDERIQKLVKRNISSIQAERLFLRSPWVRTNLAVNNADQIAGAVISLSQRHQRLRVPVRH
ncbi:RHS repeat domain-containing protein [Pseudomonas sp. PD9R]|uniref:RHS repeat domain-containing protein n=1 Tax=Pseudomonas sp. PD9R TaxID=2853534 RepID=UPI00210DCA02|nr:RHS repeat-associated core domain-containing protein [Pseudomonas sp. PD9R]